MIAGGCAALAAASLPLGRGLSFDAWSWLVWGRELAHLDLNTRAGPAWKPLPAVVDAVLSPLGTVAPDLWLVVCRTAGLLALMLAWRLARRLAGPGVAGAVAGAVAVVGLACERDAFSAAALGTSEPLLALFALLAVERHVAGRGRQAFLAGYGAALLRPETWIFLALYGGWLVWRDRRALTLVVGLGVVLGVVWFGADLWGAGDLGRSAARARLPDRTSLGGLPGAEGRIPRVLAEELLPPVLAGVGLALVRGRGAVRALALGGLAWLGLDLLLVLVAGYAGSPRYFFGAFAVLSVAAGAAWGELLAAPARRELLLSAGALLAVFVGLRIAEWIPDARSAGRAAALRAGLGPALAQAGGRERATVCGPVRTQSAQVSLVAWSLGVPLSTLRTSATGPGWVLQAEGTPGQPGFAPPVDPRRPVLGEAGPWRVRGACR